MRHFRSILVWIEDDSDQPEALLRAVAVARETSARLTLVRVVDPPSRLFRTIYHQAEELQSIVRREWEERLEELAVPLRNEGLDVAVKCIVGKPAVELIREVMRSGHDLLVKRAQRREGPLFGSTDARLLRRCPCGVWISKPGDPPATRILAAVDPDPADEQLNRRILEAATSLAEMRNGSLDVVHVWQLWGEELLANRVDATDLKRYVASARDQARAALHGLLDEVGVSLPAEHVHLFKGDARTVIPDFVRQREIGLVIIGTVGRLGIQGLLIGNTAEEILARVECSVLTLKPEGFVSPVELDD